MVSEFSTRVLRIDKCLGSTCSYKNGIY